MDAYLGARYDVSILRAQVPPLSNLVRLNCDIARYRLDADCTREPVIERYKQAIKFLEGVVKGSITLGLGAELTAESTQAAGATSGSVSRVFTQETMRGF
jgi:phage gp36-like protein